LHVVKKIASEGAEDMTEYTRHDTGGPPPGRDSSETFFRVYLIIVAIMLAMFLGLGVMMLILGSPVLLILFLIALSLGFGVPVVILIRLRNIRRKIISTRGRALRPGEEFPVLYSSKEYFIRYWKWLAYEGSGILRLEKNKAFFTGQRRERQQEIVLEFDLSGVKVNWIGRKSFRVNGYMAWFSIQTPWEEHYFALEPGLFAFGSFGSAKKTWALYQKLRQRIK
jgi:ABC-type multidrug transport system fused ATPase/permease subunit